MVPLIHNDLLHFVLWGQETISYNLFDSQKTVIRKEISNCIKQFCPIILMYSGEVTLLGGDVDVDTRKYKLALYRMHNTKEDLYSWEPIMCSTWSFCFISRH